MATQQLTGRAASMARRMMQVNGKSSAPASNRNTASSKPAAPVVKTAPTAPLSLAASTASRQPTTVNVTQSAARSASRARREALSSQGKAGMRNVERQRTETMVRGRAAANATAKDDCGCGCGGNCADQPKASLAPMLSVPATAANKVAKKKAINTEVNSRLVSRARRSAMSSRGKVGLESHRQGISSASLARQANPDISSRDLARAVRDTRSRSGAQGASSSTQPIRRQRARQAVTSPSVSGTKVGHAEGVTGDEAGLCHSGITGTQYLGAEIFEAFCQAEAPKAPVKVEATATLSGNKVTSGGKVGSSTRMTGNERGECRDVTGTEYLGQEHFAKMCSTAPAAAPAKISTSRTQRGTVISGPKPSQHELVTGNERGECRAVTGTPYLGQETFESVCSTEEARANRRLGVMPRVGGGRDISGQQPAMTGLTGNEKGACQTVSGTPYLAETEFRAVCSADAAEPGESDFPQSLGGQTEVVGEFSILPSVMMPEAKPETTAPAPKRNAVTGSGGYETSGCITGAFSMGKGKVSGTEQSRYGTRQANVVEKEAAPVNQAQVAARITGEGLDVGLKITGDDWDRGNHVTGTEGSAAMRNPTRRGPIGAMPPILEKREPQRERPSANVTGSSGGAQGTRVTLSGGARG